MDNLISYRRAVVSFIDILGFKEIIKNKSADEINDICVLFNHLHSEEISPSGIKREHDIISFSDSIVRILYIDESLDNSAYNPESDEIMSLAIIQSKLLEKGILIRGGIASGDIFFNKDSNILFGPALIEAYNLESEFAIDPRIVISDAVVCEYMADMLADPKYIKSDDHSIYWINYFMEPYFDYFIYLKTAIEIEDESGKTEHRQELINKLNEVLDKYMFKSFLHEIPSKSYPSEKIASKYKWCYSQWLYTQNKIYEWIKEFNISSYFDKALLEEFELLSMHRLFR